MLSRFTALFLATVASSIAALAQNSPLTTILSFNDGSGGGQPSYSNLIADSAGDLYSAAQQGGVVNQSCPSGCGVVFKLVPPGGAGKSWREAILYRFMGGVADGSNPVELARSSTGAIFGVTSVGGEYNQGVAFELAPPSMAGQPWTESVIYNFGAYGGDGEQPGFGSLAISKSGAIYGTAQNGGASGFGTVFELAPPNAAGMPWTESVIYSFTSGHFAGGDTVGGVTLGSKGQLYGINETAGQYNVGIAYELKLSSQGTWEETTLHEFTGGPSDAGEPITTLVEDSRGNLYGTSFAGGDGPCSGLLVSSGCGTVFKLSPPTQAGATWTSTLIHAFIVTDGAAPVGGLRFDSAGNLYGTTTVGGTGVCDIYFQPGCGTVFELSPSGSAGGTWLLTTLYNFTGGSDGAYPYAGLTVGKNSDLYGTTFWGGKESGTSGFGTAFQLTP
jgi:uncharacterized repeat protein (TIGR03803 family)